MQNGTVLVIIDMQVVFYHRGLKRWDNSPEGMKEKWTSTVKSICQEIRQAKENLIPILVVEYEYCNMNDKTKKTDGRIRQVIGKYLYVKYVPKTSDDGSAEITKTLKNMDWVAEQFRICGANRCCCVAATVRGLSQKHIESKILLVDKAITDEHNEMGWAGATMLPNTMIV